MQVQPARLTTQALDRHRERQETQACPNCGHDMPALKGARLSICPTCGYKESCCY
ncbi:MAG TPA: hypothetical protein VKU60_11640 [Chloroflexota bacterium]|nr:hypothetical protein [Chloroflexota bacterium]